MSDVISQFRDFLHAVGLPPHGALRVVADDQIHYYRVEGDKVGSVNGRYKLKIQGGLGIGWAKSHRDGGKAHTFRAGQYRPVTPAERKYMEEENEARRKAAQMDMAARHEAAARSARDMWDFGTTVDPVKCPYAVRKNIPVQGLRMLKRTLLAPLVDEHHKLWNLQTIGPTGEKRFLNGGRIKGLYHPVGRRVMMDVKPFIICEGVATGRTLWRATRCPVACAMSTANLAHAARALRRKYRFAQFIFAADSDRWTMLPDIRRDKFRGVDLAAIPGDDPRWAEWRALGWLRDGGGAAAAAAAAAVGGSVIGLPDRFAGEAGKPTDFNDMAALVGDDAIYELFRHEIVF